MCGCGTVVVVLHGFVWFLAKMLVYVICLPISDMAKMEDARVEIDDGKEESVVPDTMYQ